MRRHNLARADSLRPFRQTIQPDRPRNAVAELVRVPPRDALDEASVRTLRQSDSYVPGTAVGGAAGATPIGTGTGEIVTPGTGGDSLNELCGIGVGDRTGAP